jgi:hypothetical protein
MSSKIFINTPQKECLKCVSIMYMAKHTDTQCCVFGTKNERIKGVWWCVKKDVFLGPTGGDHPVGMVDGETVGFIFCLVTHHKVGLYIHIL